MGNEDAPGISAGHAPLGVAFLPKAGDMRKGSLLGLPPRFVLRLTIEMSGSWSLSELIIFVGSNREALVTANGSQLLQAVVKQTLTGSGFFFQLPLRGMFALPK